MKLKIFITCVFTMGALIGVWFGIEAFLQKDVVNTLCFACFFIFMVGIISQIWGEKSAEKRAELLFKQRSYALEYALNHKKGSKDEFCKECGEEMYNYCLAEGIIHEPLECNTTICWEVTYHAFTLKNSH